MLGCGDCMSTCCATVCYRGKILARCVRYKRTGDAFDFRENGFIELDVVRSNGGESVDLKQGKEVAAAALIDAEVNSFCNSRCEQ
eukprot:3746182-Pleurochrysis_carterae.AAC.1